MLLLVLSVASVLVSVSAFQSNSISLQQKSIHDVSSELLQRPPSVMLMAHPYGGYPPPPPPFADPYMMNMPYNNIYGPPPPPHMRGGPHNIRGPPPNYYQRPQDIMSEADAILNNINEEEEEWKTDQQKAKEKGEFIEGEVINFNPEQSQQVGNRRPLKNAAAYPSDLDMDDEDESSSNEDGVEDSVFQGRMPGQPVNRNNSNNSQQQQSQGPKASTTTSQNQKIEEDPRAQHVILDEYDSYMNDFFDFPIGPGSHDPQQGMPPPRGGPAVYTSEEEELIAAMGGRQRMPPPVVGGGPQPRQVNDINGMGNGQQRTTQEFAGLGTLTNNKGRDRIGSNSGDPQQLNYNPEQNFNPQQGAQGEIMPPPPQGMPMIPPPGSNQASLREEGFLGDSTLKEISLDYSVPIPYLADVLATWGVPIPINPNIPLGDMITGEQTFAILEAIHTLDIGQLHEMYSEDNIMNICDYYDIDIKVAFDYCMERGWALPFGVRTFLRVEQEEELLEVLG